MADQVRAFASHFDDAATREVEGRWPRCDSAAVASAGGLAVDVRAAALHGWYPGVTISLRGAPRAAGAADRNTVAAHRGRAKAIVATRRAAKKLVFMMTSPGLKQALIGPGSSVRAGATACIPIQKERLLPPGDDL